MILQAVKNPSQKNTQSAVGSSRLILPAPDATSSLSRNRIADLQTISTSSSQFSALRTGVLDSSLQRLIDKFETIQFQAYRRRLAFQPGGEKILHELDNQSPRVKTDQKKSEFAQEYFRRVLLLGKEPLKLFRAYGELLLSKNITNITEAREYHSKIITGVTDNSNYSHHLSGKALLALADAIHETWKQVTGILNGSGHRSASAGIFHSDDLMAKKVHELPPILWNPDMLGGMFLCEQLAKLSSTEFNLLLSLACEGNPQNLELQFISVPGKKNQELSFLERPLILNFTDSPTAAVVATKENLPVIRTETFSRYSERVKEFGAAFENSLKTFERLEILPLLAENPLFAESQLTFNAWHQDLLHIKKARRSLTVASQLLLNAYCDQLFQKKVAFSNSSNPIDVLAAVVNPKIISALQTMQSRYVEKRHQLSSRQPSTEKQKMSFVQESQLSVSLPVIRKLIDAHAAIGSEQRPPRVLIDYYHKEFLSDLLQSGGRILTQQDAQTGELQGFIIYYHPGKIPTHHQNVPENYHNETQTSFADLVMTASNRPKGTFRNLIRMMQLDLSLTTEAAYSEGLLNLWNSQSAKALKHTGHFPLTANLIEKPENPWAARFGMPMRLVIDPTLESELFGLNLSIPDAQELFDNSRAKDFF